MMLEEKAKDLGRLIGQSAEYQAVKRANDAIAADKAAMALLKQMEQIREKAHTMLERGEQPTGEMEERLNDLLGTVQQNSAYQRLIVAQENFDKTMAHVNGWILDGMKKGAASPIITLG
jgi:cell fate (sporulation/competence/biofilm development) regulator YlbF (YheA/YmcA/DUF963 family)